MARQSLVETLEYVGGAVSERGGDDIDVLMMYTAGLWVKEHEEEAEDGAERLRVEHMARFLRCSVDLDVLLEVDGDDDCARLYCC